MGNVRSIEAVSGVAQPVPSNRRTDSTDIALRRRSLGRAFAVNLEQRWPPPKCLGEPASSIHYCASTGL